MQPLRDEIIPLVGLRAKSAMALIALSGLSQNETECG